MDLTSKSLSELNSMTKSQIISEIMGGVAYIEVTKDIRGVNGPSLRVESVKDKLSGNIVSERTITWTYYKEGCVEDIMIKEKGKRKIIHHYDDGRQPILVEDK